MEKNVECTMYLGSVRRVQILGKERDRTKRFKFLRYLRLRLRYAFHTQFQPGVCLPPAAKKTTV